MTDSVITVEVRWNGLTLEARPYLEAGWELLVGPRTFKLPRTKTACSQWSDLTAFELGMFLATACRPILDCWENERQDYPHQQTLWTENSGHGSALPG